MSFCTQKAALLAYLKVHHFITRRDAARKLELMNLWQRVAELEDDGYKFDRRRVVSLNGRKVLQYWLRPTSAKKAA